MRYTLWIISLITATVMLWIPAEIFFGDVPYNLFITKENTYAQPIKWYVVFTQIPLEKTVLYAILYWHLSKYWKNLYFLIPFLVYNAYCIFEYWLFAFSIDRYMIIISTLVISAALYGHFKPKRKHIFE